MSTSTRISGPKLRIVRFCGGSAEELVIGMVKNDVLSARQLERLVQEIARQKGRKS